ncbi:glycosyltransferase family 2 protein [Vibrio parahaemolyticus]|nr:glycosyltransferase family 2 protein [Vibrio parahaemolyticus]
MISFIIPLYNKSRYIEKCITSVLASTTSKEIEIVVVDDCSTDNSIEVLKSIKDERVKLIALSENRGPSAARNVGAKKCKKCIIVFFWMPTIM